MTDQDRIENLEREIAALREALAHTLTACSKTPFMIGTMNALFTMLSNKTEESMNQDAFFALVNTTQQEFEESIRKAIEIVWNTK